MKNSELVADGFLNSRRIFILERKYSVRMNNMGTLFGWLYFKPFESWTNSQLEFVFVTTIETV